jgi:NADH-quinone oxidoreductase subunit A
VESQYLGILVLLVVAGVLSGAMVTLSWLLGPKRRTPYKASPYECGVAPVGSAHERFPIKFYLVAILFVLFDIEVVFLWGWMTVFRDADNAFKLFSFIEVIVYMSTWILGYVYAIRVNAIDWDETVTLSESKLGRGGAALEPAAGGS